jgi:hypothetical protein
MWSYQRNAIFATRFGSHPTPDNRDGDDEGMKNIWVMKTVRSVKTMTMKTSVWVLTTVALVRNLNKI